jgi:hypothetical protein
MKLLPLLILVIGISSLASAIATITFVGAESAALQAIGTNLVTAGVNTSTGDVIIIGISHRDAGVDSSIRDSIGNTYTLLRRDNNVLRAEFFYTRSNASNTANKINVTLTGSEGLVVAQSVYRGVGIIGSTQLGTGSTATMGLNYTITKNNAWVATNIAQFGNAAQTALKGNQRAVNISDPLAVIHDSSGGLYDNTTATSGQNTTTSATGSGNSWVAQAVELQPDLEPLWSNQSQNQTANIISGNTIKFSAFWTDDVNLSSYIFSWNESGSYVNDSAVVFSSSNWSNVTKTIISADEGKTIGWKIYANDSINQFNVTGTIAFYVNDTTYPQWSSQTENVSTAYVGQAIKLSAYWTDNVNLSTAILSTNSSGTWVNNSGRYGSPFAFTSNASFSNFTWINASIGPGTYGWQIWANDTSNNWNVTSILTFNITSNSTLQFSVNQTIYPQGKSPGTGYDQTIPFQARYLDYAGNPISGATCAVTNNETSDSVSLTYNVTSGNYTKTLNNYQLYDLVSFTANCSKTLYDSGGASTTTNVWWYNYLTEEANKTYDGGVSTTHWLEKLAPGGSLYTLSITMAMASGVNAHGDFLFPYLGSGSNYSMLRNFNMGGLHTLRLNMSVNDTTCQPILCVELEDQFNSEIYKQCSPNQAISANTPTLIEANLTGLTYSIDQGYYLHEELYLNCTSPVTELVNIYYNYSGEPANIEIRSPKTMQMTTTSVKFQQLESGYNIGPNQTANITGKTWITFNNTLSQPQFLDYYYLVPIEAQYWNDNLAANTVYVYNSTNGLWASDNASAGAPHTAILYSATKQIRWTTETITNGTAVNETVQGLIKDALRNTETLLYSDAYKKRWQANAYTIFSQLVKATTLLTNTTVWTNISTYGVQSNWKFSVNLTNTTGTYDITSQTTIDPATGKMTFPTANLSGDYAYTVEASTFAVTNLTISPDDDPGTPGVQVNPVSCSNKTITINMSFSGYPSSCNVSLFDSAHSFASPNYVPTFTMNGNNCVATQDLTYYNLNGTWNATTQTNNGAVVTNSTTFTYNGLESISLSNTPIQFSSGYPDDSVNATAGNGYPMNVTNCGNLIYPVYVSGTNMTGQTDAAYHIPVGNILYGNSSPSINLSTISTFYDLKITSYQETANAVALEGSWTNGANTYDGDWSTYGSRSSGSAILYENYSKPSDAVQATTIWAIKDGVSSVNMTIPSDCWSQAPIQVKVNSTPIGDPPTCNVIYYCFNGSAWNTLYTNGDGCPNGWNFYEDAMYWKVTNIPTNNYGLLYWLLNIPASITGQNYIGTTTFSNT